MRARCRLTRPDRACTTQLDIAATALLDEHHGSKAPAFVVLQLDRSSMANVSFTRKSKGGAFSYLCPPCTEKSKARGKGDVYVRALCEKCPSTGCNFKPKYNTVLKNGEKYEKGYQDRIDRGLVNRPSGNTSPSASPTSPDKSKDATIKRLQTEAAAAKRVQDQRDKQALEHRQELAKLKEKIKQGTAAAADVDSEGEGDDDDGLPKETSEAGQKRLEDELEEATKQVKTYQKYLKESPDCEFLKNALVAKQATEKLARDAKHGSRTINQQLAGLSQTANRLEQECKEARKKFTDHIKKMEEDREQAVKLRDAFIGKRAKYAEADKKRNDLQQHHKASQNAGPLQMLTVQAQQLRTELGPAANPAALASLDQAFTAMSVAMQQYTLLTGQLQQQATTAAASQQHQQQQQQLLQQQQTQQQQTGVAPAQAPACQPCGADVSEKLASAAFVATAVRDGPGNLYKSQPDFGATSFVNTSWDLQCNCGCGKPKDVCTTIFDQQQELRQQQALEQHQQQIQHEADAARQQHLQLVQQWQQQQTEAAQLQQQQQQQAALLQQQQLLASGGSVSASGVQWSPEQVREHTMALAESNRLHREQQQQQAASHQQQQKPLQPGYGGIPMQSATSTGMQGPATEPSVAESSVQHMPAQAADESQLQGAGAKEPWADASHDEPASTLEDLAKDVPTVPAAGTRGCIYEDLSDDQVLDLSLPGFQGFQVHLPDGDSSISQQ